MGSNPSGLGVKPKVETDEDGAKRPVDLLDRHPRLSRDPVRHPCLAVLFDQLSRSRELRELTMTSCEWRLGDDLT
jgi:hypothetical protein